PPRPSSDLARYQPLEVPLQQAVEATRHEQLELTQDGVRSGRGSEPRGGGGHAGSSAGRRLIWCWLGGIWGTAIVFNTSSTTRSASIPSASASYERTTRWRNTSGAIAT